jgi:PKD domain
MFAAASPALALNAVQVENAKPGDSYWRAALQDPVGGQAPIEGYANATSVRPGGTITFDVSTSPAADYRIEISRLGWYGGKGGRRITCLEGMSTPSQPSLDPACANEKQGIQQPQAPAPDPVTGQIQAGWSPTDSLTVPSDWTSGYYLAVFRLTSGPSMGETGFAPFIVQAPAGDHSAILVQVPTNTWLAYNTWGGEGVYTTPEAVKVSFNRPYNHRLLFSWEYPLVRFLERGGWDVSYATDDDVDADPSILLNHKLDMSAGHDEYWTSVMRTGWEAARDAGVNLAFMGADDANWQVRYEDGRRTMVAYKYLTDPVTDPGQTTTMFRFLNPPRPECELMGVEFQGTVIPGTYLPYTADAAVATDPWFAGTGLTPGSVLTGLGGYEVDSVTPDCHVPPVTPLLSYSGPPVTSNFNGAPTHADAARYTACSGAEVFSSGSLQFSWGLDSFRDPAYSTVDAPESAALEQAMTRALSDLTVSHVPRPGPPQICVPTPGFTVPASSAAVGQPVTFDSTSTDAYGRIGSQVWSFAGDGGAAVVTGPSATRTFTRPGTARITLHVTDSSGAPATVVQSVRICACPAPHRSGGWPAGAESTGPCAQVPMGSVRRVGDRYWFEPSVRVRRMSVTTYRLSSPTGRPDSVRTASWAARGTSRFPVGSTQTPIGVDIAAQIAGRTLHERFVLAPRRQHGGAARPRPLADTTCDGTSASVLTPAFGGPLSLPLRVAVGGTGRVTITLTTAGARPIVRRVAVRRKDVVVAWPSSGLRGGTYNVRVSSARSWLPQPFVLSATRVGGSPRKKASRRGLR